MLDLLIGQTNLAPEDEMSEVVSRCLARLTDNKLWVNNLSQWPEID